MSLEAALPLQAQRDIWRQRRRSVKASSKAMVVLIVSSLVMIFAGKALRRARRRVQPRQLPLAQSGTIIDHSADVEVVVKEFVSVDGIIKDIKSLCIIDVPGMRYNYKQLRFLCSKLGATGYKNRSKAVMIARLIQRKINVISYDKMFEEKMKARSDPPQKQQ